MEVSQEHIPGVHPGMHSWGVDSTPLPWAPPPHGSAQLVSQCVYPRPAVKICGYPELPSILCFIRLICDSFSYQDVFSQDTIMDKSRMRLIHSQFSQASPILRYQSSFYHFKHFSTFKSIFDQVARRSNFHYLTEFKKAKLKTSPRGNFEKNSNYHSLYKTT